MSGERTFIEKQNDVSYQNNDGQDEKNKRDKYSKDIMKDKQRLVMLIFVLLFTLFVPIIIYFITTNLTFIPNVQYSCSVDTAYRIKCGKVNITKAKCININCCYDDRTWQCYHFVPSKYNYHRNRIGDRFQILEPNSQFHNTIRNMQISVLEIDDKRLKIILHPTNVTYVNESVSNTNYYVKSDARLLGIEVFRKVTNEMILTTLRGPLIASLHYWEWTVHLITQNLFGLGELIYNANVTVTKVIYKNKYDHNTLPNFLCTLNGLYYGVRIEHEGPLEVTVLPSKIVILKSLSGNKIEINIYMGPTPKDVVVQQKMEKFKSKSIPYWALGAHICRDGQTNINSAIQEYLEFHKNQTNLQFASDCIHENLYVMLNQANETHNLKGLIENLQKNMHFVMSVPPQIPKLHTELYNAAVSLGILYKMPNGGYLNGTYQTNNVVFPDFNHTSTRKWMQYLKKSLPTLSVDGFFLKDNWPEEDNYIFQDELLQFQYMTEELNASLSATIPWNVNSNSSQPHITHHNLYGKFHTIAYNENMQYQFLLTSSYDYEISDAAGIQNVDISWTNLKKALVTTLYNSILGNPLLSSPICGSTNKYNVKTNEEVCLRWYLMGATLPLFRISSHFPRRDPLQLATGYSRNSAVDALEKRYKLLPYYYTTLHLGEPLVRPMFYNFHSDNVTWHLDEQYMIGECLLVAQPMLPDLTQLRIYLPAAVKVWYEFWGGNPYENREWINFKIVMNDWIMFIAEGCIVPLRNLAGTKIGEHTPTDSYSFAVSLNCTNNLCYAKGLLHLDNGKLTFTANETGINVENIIEITKNIGCNLTNSSHPRYIQGINIYGLQNEIVTSNFTTIDLCHVNEDSIFISYFSV